MGIKECANCVRFVLKMELDSQLDSHLDGHASICNYPFKVRKNGKNRLF